MKKKHAIYLAIALAVVGGTLALRLWPRSVPPEDCSELYRLYADTPGVDATFIRGFQVNDTLALDVTLLQATDSAGWETLVADFQIHPDFLTGRDDHIITRMAKKGHSDKQLDTMTENNDLILISDGMHTINIFHLTETKQIRQIMISNLKKI